MASTSYLYRRKVSGVYVVRLFVPERLKAAVGKGEVHRSTGCRDLRLAKIVAAEVAAEWHRALRQFEHVDVDLVRAGSINLLGGGHIRLLDAAKALGTDPGALAGQLAEVDAPFFVVAQSWLGWSITDFYGDLEHFNDGQGLAEVVIDVNSLGGLSNRRRCSARLRIRFTDEAVAAARAPSPVDICQFLVWPSTEQGFVLDLPGQAIVAADLEVFKADVERLRTRLALQLSPDTRSTRSIAGAWQADGQVPGRGTSTGKKFSDLATEYLTRNAVRWKADNIDRKRHVYEAFAELMGDLPLESISRQEARKFADLIKCLPHNRQHVRTRYKLPDAGYAQLIALTTEHKLTRLTPEAQTRMLDSLSEIFAWAIKEQYIKQNPANGLGLEVIEASGTDRRKDHEQRDQLSDEDLQSIFTREWFIRGVGPKTKAGIYYEYRPLYYWLPLLALFAGGRLNELSQLHISDIRISTGGIAYLDFNLEAADKQAVDEDGGLESDKSLKTINSKREVPVHHRLVELGFLRYVEALRAAGFTRLFPELKHDAKKGYGKAAGKWFNDSLLGKQLKIPRGTGKVFHSFRHNFATALGALEMPSTARADLLGHARSGTEGDIRYDKGLTIEEAKLHLDKVFYRLPDIAVFSVQDGIAAVRDALALKKHH